MKTIKWIAGITLLIGVLGYLDRGWFDIKGLLAITLLISPIVIALRSE